MPKKIAYLLSIVLMTLSAHAHSNSNSAEAAALAWLEAIDNGLYEKAWESSSPLLQIPLSPSMLERTIGAARRDFGPVESRQRLRVTSERSMPGAPYGDYMIFTFQTRFANNARRIETVTPHLDGDYWRVSGYYVQ
ncbi:MAG: DUF4019 domain-containing protein [Halomonas sp.]|nr:DUF4019 domain-containing protein [Halomonas sp.]TVP51614.1 MAG: DUF4019 domain-containing protein [Halomonas sp.]